MKTGLFSAYVSAGAVLTFLSLSTCGGQAASASVIQNSPDNFSESLPLRAVEWEQAKADTLRRAYHLLSRGDHDYRGHRVKAMEHVEKAAGILGVDLKGDARGGEKQVLSDIQLHQAKTLLESLLPDTHGKEHEHIRLAVDEIDSSLAIK